MSRTKIFLLVVSLSFLALVLFSCSKTNEETKVEPAAQQVQQPQSQQSQPVDAAKPQPANEPAISEPARSAHAPAARQTAPRQRRVRSSDEPASRRTPSPVASGEPVEVPSTPRRTQPVTEPEPIEPAPSPRRGEFERVATPPSPPRPMTITTEVPEGTVLEVRLNEAVSSAENQSGDKFEATVDRDITIDGRTIVPRGSRVYGKILDVVPSGKVQGRAQMSLILTDLIVGEKSYTIETSKISFEAEGTKDRDAKTVGGGAGLGALIGAVAGGKKGAAIGAAIGGGAATAGVLLTKGKEVEFQPEHKFSFRLEKDLSVTVR